VGAESVVFAAALSTNSSLMRQTNLLMVDYPDNFNDTVRKSFLGECDLHADVDPLYCSSHSNEFNGCDLYHSVI
jgi:hypothetical protein